MQTVSKNFMTFGISFTNLHMRVSLDTLGQFRNNKLKMPGMLEFLVPAVLNPVKYTKYIVNRIN